MAIKSDIKITVEGNSGITQEDIVSVSFVVVTYDPEVS
jgi:hypothetical protein